eukprot:664476-Pleurochrysis_carterae.AAC.1
MYSHCEPLPCTVSMQNMMTLQATLKSFITAAAGRQSTTHLAVYSPVNCCVFFAWSLVGVLRAASVCPVSRPGRPERPTKTAITKLCITLLFCEANGEIGRFNYMTSANY